MASSCFGFLRSRSKDVYEPSSVPNGIRNRSESNLSTGSSRSQRGSRGGSDVQQIREKNGAITFESASGKVTVIPDARIPLTPRQCYMLMQNWRSISRRISYTGITMLARLFEKDDRFGSTFGRPSSSGDGKVLERHAHSVTQVFDEAIRAIGDAERFFEIVKKNAQVHARIPKFQPEWFRALEQPFLCAIKITLEDYYTEQMDHVYKAVVRLIIDTMVEECERDMMKGRRLEVYRDI